MSIDELLEYNGLSLELLNSFSYQSQLGMSLKRTLSHFDKEQLLNEIFGYADWLNNWLHDYLYKKGYPLEYGQRLRCEYEQGRIRTEKDFTEVLYNDLLGRQE